MVERKKQTSARQRQPPRKASESPPAAAPASRESAGRAPKQEKPRGRSDQLGTIVAKGLDLAEASLSLGLTMISRFGAVAQQQVFDRLAVGATAQPGAAAAERPPEGAEATYADVPAPHVTAPEEAPFYCVTNRTPLTPGARVKVSFSINNDSVTAAKKVSVRIEGFAGENEHRRLDAGLFSVKPATRTIAPTDFEKFVLEGTVPPDAPPDTYVGSIVVFSEDEFRIPVRIVVMTS